MITIGPHFGTPLAQGEMTFVQAMKIASEATAPGRIWQDQKCIGSYNGRGTVFGLLHRRPCDAKDLELNAIL